MAGIWLIQAQIIKPDMTFSERKKLESGILTTEIMESFIVNNKVTPVAFYKYINIPATGQLGKFPVMILIFIMEVKRILHS